MPIRSLLSATGVLALPHRQPGESLHRWLFEGLRAGILQARLPAGLKLPATRALASQIGVARGTVAAAYDELAAQGYLDCSVGRGSFVAKVLPEKAHAGSRKAGTLRDAPAQRALGHEAPVVGLAWARTPFAQHEPMAAAMPFRAHLPDTRLFPLDAWRQLATRSARALTPDDLGVVATPGLPLLREAIAGHLAAARGVSVDARQILVVSSTQQALDLCARLLAKPGQAVWLEDPGYPGTRALLAAHGLQAVDVPVDRDGLQVAEGMRRAPRARLACVTPSRHAPLGVPLSAARRRALLDWASRAGSFVIEDDYDSEYRYATRPIPALKALDGDDRVLLLGTFSKLLYPALRLAYLVLPQALVDAFVKAHSLAARGLPSLEQRMVARFVLDGHFERHVRRTRKHCAARAEALRYAIARHAQGLVEVPAIDAGLDVSVRLLIKGSDRSAQQHLLAAGVEAVALSRYTSQARLAPGLVLGFAAFDETEIDAAVRRMARVLNGLVRRSR